MSRGEQADLIRVVCTECSYARTVEKGGDRPAAVITDHGRATGHKLTTEDVEET